MRMLIISSKCGYKNIAQRSFKEACVPLLTELFVTTEQVTEPDLHLSDIRIYNEMFDCPPVIRHMSFNRPRAFNVL